LPTSSAISDWRAGASTVLGEAGQHRHDAHVPVPHPAGGDQRGEHERQRGQREVGHHQQAPLGEPIGDGAADEREEQDGRELHGADEA
jgi:hypothetical protein